MTLFNLRSSGIALPRPPNGALSVPPLYSQGHHRSIVSDKTSTMSGSGSSSLPRLGPTWSQGGRGFQPPPPVPAERARTRSSSTGSTGSETKPNINKFSVLDDDDDVVVPGNGEKRPSNSRSEALRSFQRTSSGGPKPTGRSLADLAARTPVPSRLGSTAEGGGRVSGGGDSSKDKSSAKVIRFTRERLLSMRPSPKPDAESPPPFLKQFEGSVILAMEAQDPGTVCGVFKWSVRSSVSVVSHRNCCG